MRRLAVVIAVVAVAVTAAQPAAAGCMATVGLAPPPAGIGPGERWNALITVLQHGIRPMNDVEPRITIVNDASGASKSFPARFTGKDGHYAAAVVFPSAGAWRYEVDDGFVPSECAQTHSFAAVSVGGAPTVDPPAPPAPPEAPPVVAAEDGGVGIGAILLAGAGGAVGLAALVAALAAVRRQRALA